MSLFNKIKNNLEHYQIINLLSKAKDASENLNYTGDLTIDYNNYWLKNISKLANFLNFAGYNEDNVSYQNIKDFIDSRTNLLYGEDEDWLQILQDFENEEKTNKEKSNFKIFSPTKMNQPRTARDLFYLQSDNANNFRNALNADVSSDANIKKKDLAKAMQLYNYYQEHKVPRIPVERKEPYGDDMDKIAPLVTSSKRDIRRIHDAQSLVGAQNWIKKHKFDEMYNAEEQDLDNDGVPEVIVKRKDGTPVIVNGYTTVDSTFPYRYRYYTKHPTAEARKGYGKGFKGFINDIWDPVYDQNGLKIIKYNNAEAEEAYTKQLLDAGYKKILKPQDKNVYQVFVSKVIKPLYDYAKVYAGGKYPGDRKIAKVASNVWSKVFVTAAMIYVYGENILNSDIKQWNKLKSNKNVKAAAERFAVPYIINGPEKVAEFFSLFTEAEGFTMDDGTLQGHQAAILERMNKAAQPPPPPQ